MKIIGEFDAWTHQRHHQAESSGSSQPEEQAMTTPQQPRVVDSLHAITAEIQANNLAAALIESQLGSRLSPSEIGTVLAFVGGIEDPRRRAQVQQQHDAQQAQ